MATDRTLRTAASARWRRQVAAGLVVALVALNLRPALTGVAPMLPEIMRDTGLDPAGASLLATLPVLCLGVFAAFWPATARRFGIERTVLGLLAGLAAGLFLRTLGGIALLFTGTILAGAAIGLGNVLMPAVLKRDFAGSPALMTGIYTMALCLGAAIAAGAAVPTQRALGGSWAAALALWCVPAACVCVVTGWIWRRPIAELPPAIAPVPGARALRLRTSPLAWQVTLYMGLQSMLAYGMFAWLAPILRSRGDDARTAGFVVAVSMLAQVAASLPAPYVATRFRSQSIPSAASVLLVVASFLGLLAAPLAWQWVLAILLGLGMGAAFALAITLMVLRSADGSVAARLSGMSQSIGYTLEAV